MTRPLSDKDLILELRKSGDIRKQEIYLTLYERYKLLVLKVCYHYLADYEQAGDLLHEVFIKVIEKSEELKNPATFKSWLMTITRNLCVDYLRKTSVLKTHEPLTPEIEVSTKKYSEETMIAELDRETILKHLSGCIGNLEVFDVNVLKLRWKGLRAAEILELVQTDKPNLRRSYDRIKRTLEGCMEKKGLEVSIEQILTLGELDD